MSGSHGGASRLQRLRTLDGQSNENSTVVGGVALFGNEAGPLKPRDHFTDGVLGSPGRGGEDADPHGPFLEVGQDDELGRR